MAFPKRYINSSHVFNTIELLEQILLNVPNPGDLLRFRRINRLFDAIITTRPGIRYLSWKLTPSGNLPPPDPDDNWDNLEDLSNSDEESDGGKEIPPEVDEKPKWGPEKFTFQVPKSILEKQGWEAWVPTDGQFDVNPLVRKAIAVIWRKKMMYFFENVPDTTIYPPDVFVTRPPTYCFSIENSPKDIVHLNNFRDTVPTTTIYLSDKRKKHPFDVEEKGGSAFFTIQKLAAAMEFAMRASYSLIEVPKDKPENWRQRVFPVYELEIKVRRITPNGKSVEIQVDRLNSPSDENIADTDNWKCKWKKVLWARCPRMNTLDVLAQLDCRGYTIDGGVWRMTEPLP